MDSTLGRARVAIFLTFGLWVQGARAEDRAIPVVSPTAAATTTAPTETPATATTTAAAQGTAPANSTGPGNTARPGSAGTVGEPERGDVLGEALARLAATRADLGYRPHASWTRFPNPQLVPYKLPLFDDLYSEPLRLYDLGRTMGNTAQAFLVPGAFDAQPQALHKLLYFLAVDKRVGGFRDYSVNLPDPSPRASLFASLQNTYAQAGEALEPRSFGKPSVQDGRENLQNESTRCRRACKRSWRGSSTVSSMLRAGKSWRCATCRRRPSLRAVACASSAPRRARRSPTIPKSTMWRTRSTRLPPPTPP
jgi:hypothetical protein